MRSTAGFCFIVNFIVATGVLFIDLPAGIAIFCILVFSLLYSGVGSSNTFQERISLSMVVCTIYILSSIISSRCFSGTSFFLAADPMHYIQIVKRTTSIKPVWDELERTYLQLNDNNGLYNAMLRMIGYICFRTGQIPSTLLITLPQTLFGILTIQTLYRILSCKFGIRKCFRYALAFGCCSLTLLYSGIIVRDIIIAFFYALCLEIVLRPFSYAGVVKLAVILVICMGLRLFSGFFVSFFILYYVFFNVRNSATKVLVYPVAVLTILTVSASAFFDDVVEKTDSEVQGYAEWQMEEATKSEGFSAKLRKLPPGISQVALSLYSQMNPFPPYSALKGEALDGPQLYMASILTLEAVWWFFVSYTLLSLVLFHKGFKKIGTRYTMLFIIAWILIAVSSSMHVDIRRLMPVYTIIYFLYLYCVNYVYPKRQIRSIKNWLGCFYIILNIVYITVK